MNPKPDNREIYNENWPAWHEMKLYGPASRWLRKLISEQLRIIKSDEIHSVLDLGCGEGTITFELAKNIPDAVVYGTDFSATGIDFARGKYTLKNLTFFHEEGNECLNNTYDLITSFEVLEHVEDWQFLLRKMTRAANKYLLLSFPTGRMRPFEVNVGHFRNFKKYEVENFLAAHGFNPVNIFYAGYPFYSPFYRNLCNITNSGSNNFTRGKYGVSQKIVSSVFYFFFRYLSTKTKRGDQFCGLFAKNRKEGKVVHESNPVFLF